MSNDRRKNIPGQSGFCLWVVPSNDGRVRKLRFTLSKAVGCALTLGAIAGVFIFVAGDYARVQLLRAKNFISLQIAEKERDNLLAINQSLESQVKNLKSVQGRVASYEQNIKQRLNELAFLVQSTEALGLLHTEQPLLEGKTDTKSRNTFKPKAEIITNPPAGKSAVIRSAPGSSASDTKVIPKVVIGRSAESVELKEGIGGAELDCQHGECEGFTPSSLDDSDTPKAYPVPVTFRQATVNSVSRVTTVERQEDLIRQLDRYIDMLRAAPLGIPAVGHVSSGFGYRYSPFGGGIKLHEGIDFSLTTGDQVFGAGDGIVKEVRRCPTYGLMVDISHGPNVVTRYAHLSKALVTEGEHVCRGEVIALAGSTGRSTGPHLHYEVRVNSQPINPVKVLRLAQQLSQVMDRI